MSILFEQNSFKRHYLKLCLNCFSECTNYIAQALFLELHETKHTENCAENVTMDINGTDYFMSNRKGLAWNSIHSSH